MIGRDSDDEYDHRGAGSESDEDEEDIDEEVIYFRLNELSASCISALDCHFCLNEASLVH